jgi:hypothetical protein
METIPYAGQNELKTLIDIINIDLRNVASEIGLVIFSLGLWNGAGYRMNTQQWSRYFCNASDESETSVGGSKHPVGDPTPRIDTSPSV